MLISAPLWLTYAAMITGCIGAVTGITGAVTGITSLRRVRRMKALDLRLELRKAEADARSISSELPELLEKADRSHMAVAAFDGSINSGAIGLWKSQLAGDKAKVKALLASVPEAQADYRRLNPEELESKVVDIHRLRAAIDQMRDKYIASLDSDKRKRS